MTEREDWTKTKRVKAVVKETRKRSAVERVPCTPTTTLIIERALKVTMPSVCVSVDEDIGRFMLARSRMMVVLELPCAARVGEATGSGGEGHGLAQHGERRVPEPLEGRRDARVVVVQCERCEFRGLEAVVVAHEETCAS